MKKTFLFTIATLFVNSSFAVRVNSAVLDSAKKNIVLDVTYGGGCKVHKFSLQMQGCLETMPAQCTAKLVDSTIDGCEALFSETVVISLAEAGLVGDYYKGASLTIIGAKNRQTNQPSEATVILP